MGKSKQLTLHEKRYHDKNTKRKVKGNKKKNLLYRKQHLIDRNHPFNDLYFWSREVRIKDEHKCVVCGKSRKLTSHHLFSKSKFPALKYNITNGIVLCVEHHIELHNLNDIVLMN